MADQLDLFRKEFAKIEKVIDGATNDLAHVDGSIIKLRSLMFDAGKEFFKRGTKMKEGGFAGTKLEEFKKDPEAKALIDDVYKHIAAIEQQEKKGLAIKVPADVALKQLERLETGIETEIKNRKKQVSTKLGVGNKSLPDMEKLLVVVRKYAKGDDDRGTIREYKPGAKGLLTKEADDELANYVKQINENTKPSAEYVSKMRKLEPRIVIGVFNKSKIAYDAMNKATDPAEVKAKAAEIVKITTPYKGILDGAEMQKRLKTDADGPKVAKAVKGLDTMRAAAEAKA